ncbi:MAG TPA: hypothetical protein VGV60_13950 [Candidatus Polarisedimenticolia bacterium]|nr:hypothetical protein [Candidatus Polarisedimenticolia bacterium]
MNPKNAAINDTTIAPVQRSRRIDGTSASTISSNSIQTNINPPAARPAKRRVR